MVTLNVHCTLCTAWIWTTKSIQNMSFFVSSIVSTDTLGEGKMRQFSNEVYAFGIFSTPVY